MDEPEKLRAEMHMGKITNVPDYVYIVDSSEFVRLALEKLGSLLLVEIAHCFEPLFVSRRNAY